MTRKPFGLSLGWFACSALAMDDEPADAKKPAFTFRDVAFYHRYSKNELHEFTPEGQEELERCSDRLALTRASEISDGEGLAGRANSVSRVTPKPVVP